MSKKRGRRLNAEVKNTQNEGAPSAGHSTDAEVALQSAPQADEAANRESREVPDVAGTGQTGEKPAAPAPNTEGTDLIVAEIRGSGGTTVFPPVCQVCGAAEGTMLHPRRTILNDEGQRVAAMCCRDCSGL